MSFQIQLFSFEYFHNILNKAEFEGHISESNDFDLLKHRCSNHNPNAQQIAQNARLSAKWTTQSSVAMIYNYPMANMSPMALRLHSYKTYATFHDTSMEHQVMNSEKSM
jgi:hypothetical protein